MLVSTVIPVYNAEKWIGAAIESVLAQTHRDIEIIIVDDGSSDRSMSVAETALRHCRLPYELIRQQNAGAAGARNRGWRAARGRWIQFLDADDILERSKTALQSSVASDTDADVLYSDWQKLTSIDGAWKPTDIRRPVIQEDPIADLLSDRDFLQLGCMMLRKSALEAVGGFDKSHEPIEDIGLCIKIALSGGRFLKVPSAEPVASYRDLPNSFSKINHTRFIESCIRNAKLAETGLANAKAIDGRTVDAIVDVYFTGTRFYAGFDWQRFDQLLAEIRRLKPDFVPKAPRQLNILSRIAGYRAAEQFAVLYRKGKSFQSVRRGAA